HGLAVVAGSVAGHRNDEERERPEDGMLDRVRVLRERAVGSAAPEDEAETLASRPGPTILDRDERHSHPAAPERPDTEPRVQAPRIPTRGSPAEKAAKVPALRTSRRDIPISTTSTRRLLDGSATRRRILITRTPVKQGWRSPGRCLHQGCTAPGSLDTRASGSR